MAEDFSPRYPKPIVDNPLITKVLVDRIWWHGDLALLPTLEIDMCLEPEPIIARIPIPNVHAYNIVYSRLAGKVFNWKTINGSTFVYNIFYDMFRRNITYSLYMDVARTLTLIPPRGLPQISKNGHCRISALCFVDEVYVQTMPAYVDAVSYVIYMSISYKKFKRAIRRAKYIILGRMYIFSRDVENYRVVVLGPASKQFDYSFCKSEFDNSIATHSSDASSGNSSSKIGGAKRRSIFRWFSKRSSKTSNHQTKEAPVVTNRVSEQQNQRYREKEIIDEKVIVSLIDFGGPPRIVSRWRLYPVESVSMELTRLPHMAIKVNIRHIFGSCDNNDYRIAELRTRQRDLLIQTVGGGNVNTLPTIDILHEF